MNSSAETFCGNGHRLDEPASLPFEEREPCPGCKSKIRRHQLAIHDSLTPVSDELLAKFRQRRKEGPGPKKWDVERISGDEYSHGSGVRVNIFQLVDKFRNWLGPRLTTVLTTRRA
jgi:hypothetical protein